jgi:hypothetical protein
MQGGGAEQGRVVYGRARGRLVDVDPRQVAVVQGRLCMRPPLLRVRLCTMYVRGSAQESEGEGCACRPLPVRSAHCDTEKLTGGCAGRRACGELPARRSPAATPRASCRRSCILAAPGAWAGGGAGVYVSVHCSWKAELRAMKVTRSTISRGVENHGGRVQSAASKL